MKGWFLTCTGLLVRVAYEPFLNLSLSNRPLSPFPLCLSLRYVSGERGGGGFYIHIYRAGGRGLGVSCLGKRDLVVVLEGGFRLEEGVLLQGF